MMLEEFGKLMMTWFSIRTILMLKPSSSLSLQNLAVVWCLQIACKILSFTSFPTKYYGPTNRPLSAFSLSKLCQIIDNFCVNDWNLRSVT